MVFHVMSPRLLNLLFVDNSSPREEEDVVLHCVDYEADDGQDDKEEDDNESDSVVFLHLDLYITA